MRRRRIVRRAGWFWMGGRSCVLAARLMLQDSFNGYSGTQDTWLNEAQKSDNYGGDAKLVVRYDSGDGGYAEDCALVRFDLPAVPHDTLTSATLELFYLYAGSMMDNNALGLKPYRVHPSKNWFENTRNGTSGEGANWRYFGQGETATNLWTYESGGWDDKLDDGNSSNLLKEAGGSVPGAIEPTNWVPFDVRRSLTNWFGGAKNNGLILFSCNFQGGGSEIYARFASRETNDAARRPRLRLQYEGAQITWTGRVSGAWDTASTNWSVGGWPGCFDNGDHVLFCDAALQTNITTAPGLAPASVTISNNTRMFRFAGSALGGTGTVLKTGAGTAILAASNAFSGPTAVESGTLTITTNAALGTAAGGTIVGAEAVLALQGGLAYSVPEPLSLAGTLLGSSSSNEWTGPITLGSDQAAFSAAGLATLHITGLITGKYGVAVGGQGAVSFGGSGSSAYAGTTTVYSGTLLLNRSAAPAIPGALVIGGSSNATVRLTAGAQLAATHWVHVQEFGALDLNSFGPSTPLRNLRWRGGSVSSGNGPLTLTTDVVSEASAQSGALAGIVLLGATDRIFQVANGGAQDDFVVTAILNSGGIRKTGEGRLRLCGSGHYESPVRVEQGEVIVEHDQALGWGEVSLGPGTNGAALYMGAECRITNTIQIVSGGSRTLGTLQGVATGAWAGAINLSGPLALQAASSSQLIMERDLSGPGGSVNVMGGGTVALHGEGDYTGGTVVGDVTLWVCHADESALGEGPVQLLASGTLGGTGFVRGAVTVESGAVLNPGCSIGVLAISNQVVFRDGSVLLIEAAGGANDVLDFRGGGGLEISPAAELCISGTLMGTDAVVIVRGATQRNGEFRERPEGSILPPPNEAWRIHYTPAGIYLGRNAGPLWYFRGYAVDGQACVSWRTAVELDVAGYDLYREESGTWTRINADPWPPQDPGGAPYSLVDFVMAPNRSARYRLVELLANGASNELFNGERTFSELAFTAGPAQTGSTLELRWRSRSEETYWIEWARAVGTSYTLRAGPVEAEPEETRLIIPSAEPAGFFRVVLPP